MPDDKFDHEAASFDLSMDTILRVRAADPAALAADPPRTLGELEFALGLQLPDDLYVDFGIATPAYLAS